MKKIQVFLIVCLVAIIGTTMVLGTAQAADRAEFITAGGYAPPPAWHGNPFGPGGGVGWCTFWYLFESPFLFIPGTGEFIPRLAVTKELLDDGARLVLHLREGVLWHDGTPFTSKDLLTSWNLRRAIHVFAPQVVAITAIDDHTVEFQFIAPVPVLMPPFMGDPIRAAHHIFGEFDAEALAVIDLQREVWDLEEANLPVPEALAAELVERRGVLAGQVVAIRTPDLLPIGTGAFELVEVFPFEKLLARFEDHWLAETTFFEYVRMTRWVAHEILWGTLKVGAIDATHPATPKDLTHSLLAMQPALRHAVVTDLAEKIVLFNHRRFPFYITEFRRAMVYVLDRETIRDVSMPWAIAVDVFNHGVLPTFEALWLSPEFLAGLTRFEHNLARAEEILLGLGFTRGPGDNWLCPEGVPLEWVMRPFAPHTDWVLAGVEVAVQLTAFGIPTTVLTIPPDMRPMVYGAGDFDLTIEFGTTWWGTGHPFTGFHRMFGGWLPRVVAGHDPYPVVTIDGVVFDTGAILDEFAVVICPERALELVEKLAFVMNEWVPHITFAEKQLQIFHMEGIRVTGWPDADDPVWTLAPGGISRVYMLLKTTGVLRPVE